MSHSLSAWGTFAALVCFYADTMLIFTMYGGGFATIPAYLADIFGTMHVGAIHGRLLVISNHVTHISTIMNGSFESYPFHHGCFKYHSYVPGLDKDFAKHI